MSFPDQADYSSGFRDLWANFSRSGNQTEYCQGWIDLQCARIDSARYGALILRVDEQEQDSFSPVAIWPNTRELFPPLVELTERVIDEECGLVSELDILEDGDGKGSQLYGVAYPLKIDQQIAGVISVAVGVGQEQQLADAMEKLQWGISWIELMIQRHQRTVLSSDLPKLKSAVEILAAVLADKHFESACMTFATELAATMGCERVSFGILHRERVKVKVISHSSRFGKRMNLTRLLEAAMEEAVFQRAEISFPAASEEHLVSHDHARLAEQHGCGTSYTLPLFSHESYYGALTLERSIDQPFSEEELEKVRAIATLSGEVLREKRKNDRPMVLIAWDSIHTQMTRLLGAGYLGRKLVLLTLIAIVIFFSIATHTYRVAADSQLEGAVRQVVVAPFDGYIDLSEIRAGDLVKRGQVLSQLDDRDLRLRRLNWVSERAKLERQYQAALANRERGQVKVLKAELEQNKAQLDLVVSQLERTVLRAPFDGFVISGDLTQRLGGAVQQGDILFEVAPLNAYRVILWVDEHQIADIEEGDDVSLVLKALPDENFAISVNRITPITAAREGGNYFRVESLLENPSKRLRPGMEGIGKIEVGERKLIYILTQPLIRWLKLQYWAWIP